MSDKEYTPTTAAVRSHWADVGFAGDAASFDRWLAAHDAATERAVRDAIVAELEARAADLAAPRHDGEEITGFTLRLVHAEHLTIAARIARDGVSS